MAEIEKARHSSLMSKKGLEASARTATNARPLAHEIFTKVNNAKDKPLKIEVLNRKIITQYGRPPTIGRISR